MRKPYFIVILFVFVIFLSGCDLLQGGTTVKNETEVVITVENTTEKGITEENTTEEGITVENTTKEGIAVKNTTEERISEDFCALSKDVVLADDPDYEAFQSECTSGSSCRANNTLCLLS